MHYTQINNLVPIIIAAQNGSDESMALLLELFSQDLDREASFGKKYIDLDVRQELQIKFVYIVNHFNVAKHLESVTR